MGFVVGEILGLAVNRRRREDDPLDVGIPGCIEDVQRTIDVDLVVLPWVLDTGADTGLRGLVVDVLDFFAQLSHKAGVAYVALNEAIGAVALVSVLAVDLDGVLFDAGVVERVEIIQNDDIVTITHEPFGEVAVDETSTAGDESGSSKSLPCWCQSADASASGISAPLLRSRLYLSPRRLAILRHGRSLRGTPRRCATRPSG